MGIEDKISGIPPKVDFEAVVMNALSGIDIPDSLKEELVEWYEKISKVSDTELAQMITESANVSYKEEALAREFIKRKLDLDDFLKIAKFRTTKAILENKIK